VSGFVGLGRDEVSTADELVSVETHLTEILDALPVPEPIELRLMDALGLVLGEDVASQVTLPAFPNSAMDGYAVVAADLAGATVEHPIHLPVVGEVLAGADSLPTVSSGRVVRIMTGAPLPVGADAVVPVETTSGGQARWRSTAPSSRGRTCGRPATTSPRASPWSPPAAGSAPPTSGSCPRPA
jgi:molybdopterin molybdotransferase